MRNTRGIVLVFAVGLLPAVCARAECITVAEARQLPAGAVVEVCNVVVTCTTDLIDSSAFVSFFVQDETGGAQVFGPTIFVQPIIDQLAVGDLIDLRGFTWSFNGAFELQNPTLLAHHGPGGEPAPLHTTGADWLDDSPTAEAYEGRFAWIAQVRFGQTGSFASLTNYTASDDGGQTWLTVRICTQQQDFVGTPIPTGCVHVKGMFGQYDTTPPLTGGYQLLPRTLRDITSCLPGDVNFDCSVGLADLAQLLAHFGETGDAVPGDGDVDGDRDVDLADLSFLLAAFGSQCV